MILLQFRAVNMFEAGQPILSRLVWLILPIMAIFYKDEHIIDVTWGSNTAKLRCQHTQNCEETCPDGSISKTKPRCNGRSTDRLNKEVLTFQPLGVDAVVE